MEKRRPKTVHLSCGELLMILEDNDCTEADKALLLGLEQGTACPKLINNEEAAGAAPQDEGAAPQDEDAVFFLDVCAYIRKRNLYTKVLNKDNTSLFSDSHAGVITKS